VKELEARHTDVADALEKMDEGVYGLCEECDEPIDLDRLQANPAARTCKKHAA
jgi:DnaK suppressor protein